MILHTTIKGEGEPVVFLHSGLETGVTDFEWQGSQLMDQFQVILPDLRGHGNSFSDHFDHFFEDAAADVAETLENLNIKAVHLIGSDLGALTAILFAHNYPHQIKSLTVSGIFPRKPPGWKQLHKKETEKQRLILRDKTQINYYNWLHNTNWREFIYLARNLHWYPFYLPEVLPQLDIEVLYIAGEFNPHEAEGASVFRNFTHIHTAVLPFAGHYVHKDQPLLYHNILLQFLRREYI